MNKYLIKALFCIILVLILMPAQAVFAETLEERLNNLVGPKEQYNTMLSPVYLRNNAMEESISPQSGELSLSQTDFVLPGRNGLDLEIKRLYKSGISNLQEMKVKYVGGAWVDYVQSDANTSSFYEDRYNLGIGMRFSFPAIEIRTNEDGTSHKFLHTEAGDVYRLTGPTVVDGVKTYFPENQTVKDVIVREDNSFTNGQANGTSKYVMVGNNGKKTYFTADGRVVGIVDRYDNTITFMYSTQTYKIDGVTRTKNLISKIIDTVGREVAIEYKEDYSFKAGPKNDTPYDQNESWKQSQNPNNIDSGDLQGKFQVVIHLPGGKRIVYDKSAAMVSNSKSVVRTRLQRVFDVDGMPKYHYWYEQTDLGFTFANGDKYSVYNRYENLIQIDFCKTNQLKQYSYDTHKKALADNGSLQYRKIFEKKDLVKKSFNKTKSNFTERFVCDVKNRDVYTYINEADGCGFSGYKENDDNYLKNTYRYIAKTTDNAGNTTTYTYNGLHEMISLEEKGADHREVSEIEYDEKKFPKKKKTTVYDIENGAETGKAMQKTENYRYDEYGNLTNYTGPIANRDADGYPVNTENTVIYSYDYDRYHVPVLKTWKNDPDTTCQIINELDDKGSIIKETRILGDDENNWAVTVYDYDNYGNMIAKTVQSIEGVYSAYYEFGTDLNGVDHKGAYLTREYTVAGGEEISKRYAYNRNTGGVIAETDGRGNVTRYEYDVLDRVVKVTNPDGTTKGYSYQDFPYDNKKIEYTDPEEVKFLYEYDIDGNLVKACVYDNNAWVMLKEVEYDYRGNKTKETDSNGHSIRFIYNSGGRLVKRQYYENDTVLKAESDLTYSYGVSDETPLLVIMTDEEGYIQKFHYDLEERLVKSEQSPDNATFYTTIFRYDYVGNKISSTDALNNTTTFTYDELGRLKEKKEPLGTTTRYAYNSMNNVITIEGPGNKMIEYVYDEAGRVNMEKTYEKGSDDYIYKKMYYDGAGNVIKVAQGGFKNGEDSVLSETTFVYNSMNYLTDEYRKVDTDTTAHIYYDYDKNGRKILTREYAEPQEKKYREYGYTYDFAGRLTGESGTYKVSDGFGGYTQYGDYRKTYVYDYAGNLIRQEIQGDSEVFVSTYAYDYRNCLVEKNEPYIEGKNKTVKYQYDKKGNLIQETSIINGRPHTKSYTNDGLGRLVKQTSQNGEITTFIYDAMNNLVKEISPRYYEQDIGSAPGMEYEYDALGRQIKVIAFDGTKHEVVAYREFDKAGNVVKEVNGEGYNAANPAASVGNVYEYDVYGNMTVYTSAQTCEDNRRNGTSFFTRKMTYDALNRVIQEEDSYGNITGYKYLMDGKIKEKTWPDGISESYGYDLTGKIEITKNDRAGNITRTFNNIFGKPYLIEYPDGTYETFDYSRDGRLTETTDRAGNVKTYGYSPAGDMLYVREYVNSDGVYATYKLTRMSYDEAHNLLSRETFEEKTPVSGQGQEITTSAGDRADYVYDKAGRIIKVTGPNGRETVNTYDADGNLVKQAVKTSQGQADIRRYSYDFRSRITEEIILVPTSDIDLEYLADARFDPEYTDRVMAAAVYAYNRNGSLKSRTDAEGNTESFEYDYDGRLVKKTDALNCTTTYRYDRNGNLVEEKNANNVSIFYEYDSLNRLVRKKAPAADGNLAVTLYIYDASGNLIKQIDPINYDPSLDTSMLAMSMLGISYVYDKMNRRIQTKDPDGRVLESIQYDANGSAIKIVDGLRYNGNMETSKGTGYVYDGLNRVIQVTDAVGNSRYYEYDILGNLTKQTDGRGNITAYEYNADGTLAKTIFADSGEMEYTYDLLGRKLTQKDQRGNVASYEYNAFGKIRQEKDAYNNTIEYKYDLNGNVVSIKDKRGSISIIRYDALNRPTEKRIPVKQDNSGNFVYSIEKYAYDNAGNLKKHTLTGTVDRFDSRETVYTYYANNLVETVTDSAGRYSKNYYDGNGNLIKVETLRETGTVDVEKYEYDCMGRLVKQIRLADEQDILNSGGMANLQNLSDAEYPGKLQMITGYEYDLLGSKIKEIEPRAYEFPEDDTVSRNRYAIRYEYDDLNRLREIIREYNGTEVSVRYWYDEEGNRVKTRNERGGEIIYEYDEMNRLKSSTDAMGNTYSYTYDLAGNKTGETNAKGYSMTYAYDKLNRLITVTDPYNTVVTENSYDENGNVVETRDAKGYATRYEYDLEGRIVKIIDPEAELKNGFTESYEYNQYGERTKVTDGLGNATSYSYDKAGRLETVTDALGVTTKYTYDKAGNKLTMTDGRGKTTRYAYGTFGMLRAMTDADEKTMYYAYDLAGNPACITDRNGNITIYIYDNRSLVTEKISANTGESITYGYDAAGNRTLMHDESGSYAYSYDKNNRLTEIRKDGSLQLTYTYDVTGNIETVTDGKGFTTVYTYDKSGRMETVTFDGKTTTYAYDINGNRESVTYAGRVKEEYSYDRNNRLIKLTNKKPNGEVISEYSYTYDITGREISKTDSYGTTKYTYDKAGRITKVEAPGKTTVYTYDNAGNRLSLLETYTSSQSSGFVDGDTGEDIEYIVKTSRYFYSSTNRLVKVVEEMSDAGAKALLEKTIDYLYDNNGNQLAETASYIRPTGGTLKKSIRGSVHGESQPTAPDTLIERTNNTYDGFNRLKTVEKIEDGVRTGVEYTYNGDDLRTRKVVKSSDNGYAPEITCFLYDRQHVIVETDETGTVKTRYVRGINYIAQFRNVEDISYFLFNGHGDTVQTVTSAGDILNQYDYDIFGNPALSIETAACSIRYAGEYLDNETGLYYLRARYYDPYTGRFISEDSYWGEDTNPLSLNLYTYAYNNPVRFIDPTGHRPSEKEIEIQRKIAQIDALKSIWASEEANKGKHQDTPTELQSLAHDMANKLRQELAELEQGDEMVAELVKSKGNDAVLWEGYKLSVTMRQAQENPNVDYSPVLKKQAMDYNLAMAFGKNATGITSDDIQNSNKTDIEAYAKAILEVSKAEKSNAISSNVIIDGISIGNAKVYQGVTTGNLRDIVTALGGKVSWNHNTGVATIEIRNRDTDKWVQVTYDTKTMVNGVGIASDGTLFTAIDGRLQVGVRHIVEMAGVDDTISWWNENGTPMVLIQPDMNNAPVQVIRAGNDLYIKAYVSFYGDANDIFPGTKQSYITTLENVKNLPRGKTYAEIIQEGIESNWKGEYEVYGRKLKVTTIIYSNSYNVNDALRSYLTYKGDKQKTLGIYVHNEGSDITTSFVTSWVIDTELLILSPSGAAVKYLQTEEERTNWSIKNPGTVHLYNRYKEETYSLDKYRQMAAHEFGHVLGIGDAYNAWYRGGTFPNQDGYYAPEVSIVYYNDERYEVWTPDEDMMLFNQKVSANDIRMVWDAWRTGKPQFFEWGSKVWKYR